MREDWPFDQDKERRDPWHPEESYRLIPRDATEQDVRLYHLHINTHFGERGLDCVMLLRRLKELEEAGEIGRGSNRQELALPVLQRLERDRRRVCDAEQPAEVEARLEKATIGGLGTITNATGKARVPGEI